jgi:pimeloyl-ACP methyl ester carboxylesterase
MRVATPDGASLPVYLLPGPTGAPSILFAHANGLAAGSYEPWLQDLAAHFRVFAFDARGHGRSAWPDGPVDEICHVDRFADDLALVGRAVAGFCGAGALHLVGHSLGAATALRLGMRGMALPWRHALLFEPPIFPPPEAPVYAEAEAQQHILIEKSGGRRAHWVSPEALHAVLQGRGLFAGFVPEMLAAHCRASLLPAREGYRLACPPEIEAAVFRSHRDADSWQRLAQWRGPLHLVGGDPALPQRGWVSAAVPDMAAAIPGAQLTILPGRGHMMMFEAPEECTRLVVEALDDTI